MEKYKTLERVPAPALIPEFGPLSGLRVLLTATVVAAPMSAQWLAEFGAEVIQVERPYWGDFYRRQMPPVKVNGKAVGAGWAQNCRNRLSLEMDVNMKNPESKDAFLRLIAQSDVWLENYIRIEDLGINKDELWEVNPKLIIGHVTGFGRPWFGGDPDFCGKATFDPLCQSMSGYTYLQGPAEPQLPTYVHMFITDYLTSLLLANAVQMALRVVEKTGKGQEIDASMFETLIRMMDDTHILQLTNDYNKIRTGNKMRIYQPATIFPCKDGYFHLAGVGPIPYERALKAMGLDSENEYPYAKYGNGVDGVESEKGWELHGKITEFCAARTMQELSDIFEAALVPCTPVNEPKVMAHHPHWHERKLFDKWIDETMQEEVFGVGVRPLMSGTPGKVWRGAPTLGQDTDVILKTLAGYTDAQIAELREKKIIGVGEPLIPFVQD
jgi:crotonobetainyl-CoA:carnitine CoA-transferase CaiB-like acyl-CoA transferase